MNSRMLFSAVLAVAAAATMSFAGAASATTITSSGGETPVFEAANENGHQSFHGSNGVTIECAAQFKGQIEKHGSSATAEGNLTSLSFTNCTNGYVTHVSKNGFLVFHGLGGGNGAVTWTGAEWVQTAKTIFGTITCVYTTSNTPIGTLTGSTATKGKATLDLNASIPRTAGSSLCGSTGTWTGNFVFNSPATLNVD